MTIDNTPAAGGNFEAFLAGIEGMLASGSLPGQTEAPRYLGVPEGYAAPGRVPASPIQADRVASYPQMPRYTEAHILGPRFYAAEDIARLQAEMARIGLYGKKPRYLNGKWDEFSQAAYEKVLIYANQGGITKDQALTELADSGVENLFADEVAFTGTKRQRDKRVDLTNPQEARTRLRAVLREELGRSPSRAEYEQFVAALSGAERANPVVADQAVRYDQGEAIGSDTTTSGGVTPEAFTEEFVIEDPALSAERNSFTRDTDYYQAAMSVLRMGGASGTG